MADVDGTELFDLFGETGFCTVCQANLEEGERIRAIEKCQHLFHADCLDPWLRTQNTCPLCRVEINQQAQQIANTYCGRYHEEISKCCSIQSQIREGLRISGTWSDYHPGFVKHPFGSEK